MHLLTSRATLLAQCNCQRKIAAEPGASQPCEFSSISISYQVVFA